MLTNINSHCKITHRVFSKLCLLESYRDFSPKESRFWLMESGCTI